MVPYRHPCRCFSMGSHRQAPRPAEHHCLIWVVLDDDRVRKNGISMSREGLEISVEAAGDIPKRRVEKLKDFRML